MKTSLFKVFSLTAIITLTSASFVFGQISTSTTGARNIQHDNSGEAKVNQVLNDAGIYFKQGLLNLEDNRRPQARVDFDKSLEVFLMSNINIKSSAKLTSCYDQLIETVFRMEFPGKQQPQIKALAATCGWSIDNKLAENVAKLSQTPAPNAQRDANLASAAVDGKEMQVQTVGFSDQKFEPSPLDELSKLELTTEEIEAVNTPEGVIEYETIQRVIANRSLGFSFRMHPMVQQYIGYYRGRGRQTMEIGLTRSGMFMRMARRIFREEGVPENVAWLGQVESAWKPTARSWAAAAGLWQFIPGTGSRYGLRQNAHVDERNSFEKATRASAQYLKWLANRYGGNWELAMAAYNCGEGNTDRAIRKAGVADFWAAYPYLPKETRNYVPNILATILIANNPNGYGFGHVRPAAPLQYELLRVPPSTSLVTVAQLADSNVEYIRYLNPEFRTNMTPPEPYIIRVPAGRGNNVAAVLRKVPSAGRTNVAVTTVMRGETAQEIANRTSVPVEQVQVVNNKAIIPQKGNNVKQTALVTPAAKPNTSTSAPSNKIQVVTVGKGDNLTKIAARFGIPAVEIARFNGLSSVNAPLQLGKQLRIPSR